MFSLHFFDKISSTQDIGKEFAKDGKFGSVIVAAEQTKGRGRFDREWNASVGGLYFTIVLQEDVSKIQYLNLAAAVCVVEVLGLDAKIKWPNDVLVEGKKICGILAEGLLGKENSILIGVGLNVNQEEFGSGYSATSIKLEKKKEQDVKKILETFLEKFSKYLEKYRQKDFDSIKKKWLEYNCTIGQEIVVRSVDQEIKGKALRLDDDCNLVILTQEGEVIVKEGDVTSQKNL